MLCGGGDQVGLCKTLTLLQAQPGGASKGTINTTDVIRNSSLAICSSQRLSSRSVPLKWYSLYILILWWEWFVFVRLFNTQPLVGSLLSEVLRNKYFISGTWAPKFCIVLLLCLTVHLFFLFQEMGLWIPELHQVYLVLVVVGMAWAKSCLQSPHLHQEEEILAWTTASPTSVSSSHPPARAWCHHWWVKIFVLGLAVWKWVFCPHAQGETVSPAYHRV